LVARAVRARYKGGVLVPLGELGLREGDEVVIRVEGRVARGLAELVDRLRREIPKTDSPIEVLEEVRS